MLQSKLFYKTSKGKSSEAESVSHDLLTRAGFIDQLSAGVFTFLPLGLKVIQKIEAVVRDNMQSAPVSSQEMLMPVLQPRENWEKTGRWQSFDVLFKLKGAGDKDYVLGPTHEEIIAPLAKKIILSYKDLPCSIFQIQTKFRNELRAKSGILRTREFLMKDLYSFHSSQEDLDAYFSKVAKVYKNIFKTLGLGSQTYETLASGGSFSKYSFEFQTVTDAGEDTICICKKCNFSINKEIKKEDNSECPNCKIGDFQEKKSVEAGNIFKLGAKYSLPFDLKFKDKDGAEKPVLMGCFGLGISRTLGAIVEVSHDDKGIIWPKAAAPFLAHLLAVEDNKKVKAAAEKLYAILQKEKIEVLYDDRQSKTVGERFAEADLIGIPYRIVVSEKTLAKNSVEIKERSKNAVKLVKTKDIVKLF